MTTSINHPDIPPFRLHLFEQTLAKLKQTQSPVKQTFLLSPTPSEESLRTDSPVLPDFPRQDALTSLSASNKYISTPSTQNTLDEPAISQSAVQMNSILPDNMVLYIQSRPPTRRGNPIISHTQHQFIVEQDIILGPEVKGQLPIIRDHDFPYYPLPPYFPPPRHSNQCKPRPELGDESVRVHRRGTRGFGWKKFLRDAFRKYGG